MTTRRFPRRRALDGDPRRPGSTWTTWRSTPPASPGRLHGASRSPPRAFAPPRRVSIRSRGVRTRAARPGIARVASLVGVKRTREVAVGALVARAVRGHAEMAHARSRVSGALNRSIEARVSGAGMAAARGWDARRDADTKTPESPRLPFQISSSVESWTDCGPRLRFICTAHGAPRGCHRGFRHRVALRRVRGGAGVDGRRGRDPVDAPRRPTDHRHPPGACATAVENRHLVADSLGAAPLRSRWTRRQGLEPKRMVSKEMRASCSERGCCDAYASCVVCCHDDIARRVAGSGGDPISSPASPHAPAMWRRCSGAGQTRG